MDRIGLPEEGRARDDVLAEIALMQREDVDWKAGRAWSLVYHVDDELLRLLEAAYSMALLDNGLSGSAFPSLERMERDVSAMTADLLHGGGAVCGNVTSGGSESILLALKTVRDRAVASPFAPQRPEVVLPRSAHPAFNKAAHYLGIRPIRVEVDSEMRADVPAMEAALGPNTILVVGSAPSYPHGVIDPIADLANIATQRNVMLHVDACVGGLLLPFARDLGREIPPFDFAVEGVTSMSADLHKYGYAAKGASVVLYRDADVYRYQPFEFDGWPGGRYSAPNVAGTRPGGAVAAAWAAFHFLGRAGYVDLTRRALEASDRLIAGITAIEDLRLLGAPVVTLLAFAADGAREAAIAGQLLQRGWRVSVQSEPASLHLTVTAGHLNVVDDFLRDLEWAVEGAKREPDRLAPVAYN